MNVGQRLLSNKLHELIVQEIDFKDSETNKFVDNTALKIILTSLSQQKRLTFYRLLGENNYHEAKIFIKTEIPDFKEQIFKLVKEKFNEIL
jgi:hypothetical protein